MSYVDTQEHKVPIIGDHNWKEHAKDVEVDGERKARGLVPRPMEKHPPGSYPWARLVDVPLIPESQWEEECRRKDDEKSWLMDVIMDMGPGGGPVPSVDQNGRGYCWQHSGVTAMLLWRALMGQPFADLSAYGPACKQKGFKDEGGWGAAGVDFLVTHGCPTSKTWPQRATDRKYDNADTWKEAKKYRFADQWADLSRAQYDRNLTLAQFVSLNIADCPTVDDYNWWGHSVCGCQVGFGKAFVNRMRALTRAASNKKPDRAEFERIWGLAHEVTRGAARGIRNSWGDGWGKLGFGWLTGSKAVPDGGCGPLSPTLAA